MSHNIYYCLLLTVSSKRSTSFNKQYENHNDNLPSCEANQNANNPVAHRAESTISALIKMQHNM